jgi:hypothetical protein
MCYFIASTMHNDLFRVPLIVAPKPYAFAVTVRLVSAVLSALVVRCQLDRQRPIGVLLATGQYSGFRPQPVAVDLGHVNRGPLRSSIETESKAFKRRVELGERSGLAAQVLTGIGQGEQVIVHPYDILQEGVRVAAR